MDVSFSCGGGGGGGLICNCLNCNGPFYRYGGHVELNRFKEYYGMPRGHEHDPIYSHSFVLDIFIKNEATS